MEFFKIRNKAIVLFVYSWVTNFQAFFLSGKRNPLISNNIIQLLNKANCSVESFILIFSKAFILAYEKLKKYISNHPALLLFKEIQCFDLRFIQSNTINYNIANYRMIKKFHSFSNTLIQEWTIYCELNDSVEEFKDLNMY